MCEKHIVAPGKRIPGVEPQIKSCFQLLHILTKFTSENCVLLLSALNSLSMFDILWGGGGGGYCHKQGIYFVNFI